MLGHIELEISKQAYDVVVANRNAVIHIGNEDIASVRLDVILSTEDTDNGVLINGFFTEVQQEGCHGCSE